MEDGILHFPEGVRGDDVGNGGTPRRPQNCHLSHLKMLNFKRNQLHNQPVYLLGLHHLDDFTSSQCNMRQPQHISTLRIPLEWPYLLSARQRTMPD
jgi:hypothetical protein